MSSMKVLKFLMCSRRVCPPCNTFHLLKEQVLLIKAHRLAPGWLPMLIHHRHTVHLFKILLVCFLSLTPCTESIRKYCRLCLQNPSRTQLPLLPPPPPPNTEPVCRLGDHRPLAGTSANSLLSISRRGTPWKPYNVTHFTQTTSPKSLKWPCRPDTIWPHTECRPAEGNNLFDLFTDVQ